jgi:hypothetical protein
MSSVSQARTRPVSRLHLAGHGLGGGLHEAVGLRLVDLAGGAQGFGLLLDVGEQRGVLAGAERRAPGDAVDVDEALPVVEARHAHAAGGVGSGANQHLVQRLVDAADAGDIGAEVGGLVDAVEVDQEVRQAGVRRAAGENVAVTPPVPADLRPLGLQRPQVEGGARGGVELRRVEFRLHLRHARAAPGDLLLLGRLAALGQLVVFVLAALRGHLLGVSLQQLLVLGVEEGGERAALVGLRQRRDGGEGRSGGGRGEEAAAVDHVSQALLAAIQRSTTPSTTVRGMAPPSSTASWNLRMSKRGPSAVLALSRRRSQVSLPTM